MLKRKIMAAALGVVFSSQLIAAESLASKTNRLEREVKELKETIYSQEHGWSNFVYSSPYIGLRSAFDGSDTATNLPSINEDMRLLQQKQAFHAAYKKHGLKIPQQPLIELSGKIEGIVYTKNPYQGSSDNSVNLSTAEVDLLVHAHDWVSGFIAIDYDDAPDFINRNYAYNSRMFLNKGFITVGNLNKSPFYGSMGQMFIPFGRYSSGQVSSPVTSWIGKTRARAINLGYKNANGFFAQIYGFKNIMKTNSFDRGANFGFEGMLKQGAKISVGTGIMSDIADSNGMQSNGNPNFDLNNDGVPDAFAGFGKHTSTNVTQLKHTVPAADIYGALSMGKWDFVAEYISSVRHFDINDLRVNNHGAKPQAFHLEAVYGFDMWKRPSHFAVAYEGSHDAFPLNVPSKRIATTLSTSIWRNTIQAIELRHDKMYGRSTTGAGRVATTSAGVPVTATSDPLTIQSQTMAGHIENMIVMQMGLYF